MHFVFSTLLISVLFGKNIILNPDFSDGLNNWNISIDPSTTVNVKIDSSSVLSGKYSILFDIEEGGDQSYYIQLWQTAAIDTNKSYEIGLKMKIEGRDSANIALKWQNPIPQNGYYVWYFLHNFQINNTNYSYGPFQYISQYNDTSAMFLIFLGTYDNIRIWIDDIYINDVTTTGINKSGESLNKINSCYQVFPNFPNPFNSSTSINYSLSQQSTTQITIYNLCGNLVKSLLNQEQFPGEYSIKWDGTNMNGIIVPSGVYVYKIRINQNDYISKKMIFQK